MVRIEKQHQARRDSLTHTSRSSDWQLPKCSLYGSCAWGRGLVVIRQCSLAVIARDGWRGDRSSIDIRQWQYKMVVFTSFITCVLSSLYSMRSFNNLYSCLSNYVVVLLLVRVFFVFFFSFRFFFLIVCKHCFTILTRLLHLVCFNILTRLSCAVSTSLMKLCVQVQCRFKTVSLVTSCL